MTLFFGVTHDEVENLQVYGCPRQKFCPGAKNATPVIYISPLILLLLALFIFITPLQLNNLLNMPRNPLNPRLNLLLRHIFPVTFLYFNRFLAAF